MGRARIGSSLVVKAERRVYKMMALTQRRTAGERAADERARAAGERVYADSELVPVGKVVRVAADGVTLELAPGTAPLDAALGREFCVLGRGDSIIALVHIEATPVAAAGGWTLVATERIGLSAEKLKGARLYVPYSVLTTAEARACACARAAELPRAWVTTMVAAVM